MKTKVNNAIQTIAGIAVWCAIGALLAWRG